MSEHLARDENAQIAIKTRDQRIRELEMEVNASDKRLALHRERDKARDALLISVVKSTHDSHASSRVKVCQMRPCAEARALEEKP